MGVGRGIAVVGRVATPVVNVGVSAMTCEEALDALKTGDPIHVQGEEMRRFIAVIDARRELPRYEQAGR